MKNIEAVIFDCDGVVVDSDKLQRESEQATALTFSEQQGIEYDPNDVDWGSMQGWGRVKIAEKLFGISIKSELAETFREAVVDTTVEIACQENLNLIPDIESFVDYLRLHGLNLGLATSSNRRIYQQYCSVTEIDFFAPRFVVAHRECVDDKPKPGQFIEVMRRMNVSPENTLIIEDSNSGITAGRYAGALVLAIATTKPYEYLRTDTDAQLAANNFRDAAQQLQPVLK